MNRNVHERREPAFRTSLQADTKLLVDILEVAVPGRCAAYLSTPITTGLRFVNWYLKIGRDLKPESATYRRRHREQVILPNLDEARNLVRELRTKGWFVLDPTSFEPVGWSQNQYRVFWGDVIERYAARLVMMDGWEYSAGCSFEFLVAVRQGIHAYSADGRLISTAEGQHSIEAAVAFMAERDVPADFNGAVAELLSSTTGVRAKG